MRLHLVGLLAVAVLVSGCTFYRPRPVTFTVRDGETGRPISDAHLNTQHWVMLDFGSLFSSIGPTTGQTDQDGKLDLIVDPTGRNFHLAINAEGYEEGYLGQAAFWHRHQRGWWRDTYDVELFKSGRPEAMITLPDGYRGVVIIQFAEDGESMSTNGRRRFEYTATARGLVRINESRLFKTIGKRELIRAREKNGEVMRTVISQEDRVVPENEVAFRFLAAGNHRNVWLYAVGTKEEADAIHREVWPASNYFDEMAFERMLRARSPK